MRTIFTRLRDWFRRPVERSLGSPAEVCQDAKVIRAQRALVNALLLEADRVRRKRVVRRGPGRFSILTVHDGLRRHPPRHYLHQGAREKVRRVSRDAGNRGSSS